MVWKRDRGNSECCASITLILIWIGFSNTAVIFVILSWFWHGCDYCFDHPKIQSSCMWLLYQVLQIWNHWKYAFKYPYIPHTHTRNTQTFIWLIVGYIATTTNNQINQLKLIATVYCNSRNSNNRVVCMWRQLHVDFLEIEKLCK